MATRERKSMEYKGVWDFVTVSQSKDIKQSENAVHTAIQDHRTDPTPETLANVEAKLRLFAALWSPLYNKHIAPNEVAQQSVKQSTKAGR